jgi:hypothetical protein
LDYLDFLQWPAMVVTVLAAWLVASRSRGKRSAGFWCFLLSNGLWIAWAWHDRAYALLALQLFLIVTNIRGVLRHRRAAAVVRR